MAPSPHLVPQHLNHHPLQVLPLADGAGTEPLCKLAGNVERESQLHVTGYNRGLGPSRDVSPRRLLRRGDELLDGSARYSLRGLTE